MRDVERLESRRELSIAVGAERRSIAVDQEQGVGPVKKVQVGNVYAIDTRAGTGYFQCVREAPPRKCELIRVLPGTYPAGLGRECLTDLVAGREVFFVKFPLRSAAHRGCVRFIDKFPVPEEVKVPRYFRDKHVVRGEFIAWHIVDSETYKRRSVKELSEEEKHLSPDGIWNDTLLAERMAAGWRPEDWA